MSEFLDYEGLIHFKDQLQERIGGNQGINTEVEKIKIRLDLIAMGVGQISLHCVYKTSRLPAANILITGLNGLDGGEVRTNDEGYAFGYFKDPGSHTLKIDYADLQWTQTLETKLGDLYELEVELTPRTKVVYSSTQNIKFSNNVSSVSYGIVGGGSGGGAGSSAYNSTNTENYITGGKGGNGGNYATYQNVSFVPETEYAISIGSGGNGASPSTYKYPSKTSYGMKEAFTEVSGSAGGSTSFMGKSASGGSGNSLTGASLYPWNYSSYPKSNAETPSANTNTVLGYTVSGKGGGGGVLRGPTTTSIGSNFKTIGSLSGGSGQTNGGKGYSVSYSGSTVESARPSGGTSGSYGGGGGGGCVAVMISGASSADCWRSEGVKGANGACIIEMEHVNT